MEAFLIFLQEACSAVFDVFVERFDLSSYLCRAVEELCDLVDGLELFIEFFELWSLSDGFILF